MYLVLLQVTMPMSSSLPSSSLSSSLYHYRLHCCRRQSLHGHTINQNWSSSDNTLEKNSHAAANAHGCYDNAMRSDVDISLFQKPDWCTKPFCRHYSSGFFCGGEGGGGGGGGGRYNWLSFFHSFIHSFLGSIFLLVHSFLLLPLLLHSFKTMACVFRRTIGKQSYRMITSVNRHFSGFHCVRLRLSLVHLTNKLYITQKASAKVMQNFKRL